MSQWTLGGTVVDCRKVSLGLAQTDTAEVEYRGSGGLGVASGDWVTLACDGTPVLQGRAEVHPYISGRRDAVRVTVKGPWELLEATGYQQSTKVAVDHAVDETHPLGYALTTVLTPEVLLGMDDDGDARTTLQEAHAIIAYAAAAGVPVSLSAGFTGMDMQPVPQNGSSCAACLLTVLRRHPDVLLWFDYAGGEPVLMATPAASSSVVTIAGGPAGADRVREAEFAPVLNYAPAGVRIVYQRTGTHGRLETHVDQAGSTGTNGRAPNVINWPMPLEGPQPPPLQTQRVRTRPIPHSDDAEDPEGDETELKTSWWRNRLAWLRLSGVAAIVTISEHLVTVDPADITPSEDEDEDIPDTWSTDPDDYPRELVDGTIPEWMPSLRAAPLTISATFTLGDTSGLSDEVKARLAKVFTDGGTTTTREAQVTGTNANTRDYTAPAAVLGPPDWPAAGIAAAYMAAFTAQAWRGSLTITGEAQPLIAMGRRLNLSGHAGEWGSMNAVISGISYSAATHETTVMCGPPDNFGFGDFFELQRGLREAAGADARAAAERRQQAVANSGGRVRGAGMTANRSVSGPGGGGTGEMIPWKCERAGLLTLRVWPASVWDGLGNEIWPEVSGETAEAEHFYDAEVEASAGTGHLYLLCTVDDTDDEHGKITAVELKLDFEDNNYLRKEAGKVKIPLCTIHSTSTTFTFLPLATFVFCLRRFGPPGADSWDITPK